MKAASPTFNETGAVELFIKRFSDMAAASEWTDVALIQLRSSLRDRAVNCGKADHHDTVLKALHMRFGNFASNSQALLANMKKDSHTPPAEVLFSHKQTG